MDAQRLLRAGTPAEVSVLAVMALTLAAGCLASAAFPMAEDTPRGAPGCARSAWRGRRFGARPCRRQAFSGPFAHHRCALHDAIGIMVAVAATEQGLMLSALGYTWTAVYVASSSADRGAALRRAHDHGARVEPAVGARADRGHGLDHHLGHGLGRGRHPPRLNARLRAQAHTDSLTGLLNRTGFAVAAARQRAMAERRGDPLALAIIDLDDFKLANDRDGHAAGDRLLAELAGLWTAALRPGDLLARFGGDEFVLTLAGAGKQQLDDVLARLARAHPTAWTAGAVLWADDESLDEAIDRADARLYVGEAPTSARHRPGSPAEHYALVATRPRVTSHAPPAAAARA